MVFLQIYPVKVQLSLFVLEPKCEELPSGVSSNAVIILVVVLDTFLYDITHQEFTLSGEIVKLLEVYLIRWTNLNSL